jgi:uncharacterized membrane protein
MSRFEQQIDVNVPVGVAYDQWTQFETFPRFMDGVKSVRQVDDKTLEWVAEIAGQERTWRAEITDQTPDARVAWKSTDGSENAGAVLFAPLGPDQTRVTLRIDADPEGLVENVGDKLGFLERRVKGDLERFKRFVESRGTPTGAWRGEIHGAEVRDDRSDEDRPTEALSGKSPQRSAGSR